MCEFSLFSFLFVLFILNCCKKHSMNDEMMEFLFSVKWMGVLNDMFFCFQANSSAREEYVGRPHPGGVRKRGTGRLKRWRWVLLQSGAPPR